ncbi:MAG: hypothetical protein IJZ56_06475 [Oscillospiraceae bacterium]|nr:hypothetical protein [Oscillospiraceae bacterium]
MRDKLIQYVNFLFAGAPDAEEVKQEILQNTLDRFDDLINQGKTPEAAYSLAISGIGDISEILGTQQAAQQAPQAVSKKAEPAVKETPIWKKLLRATAVFLYVICIIPLIVLCEFGMETIGLCATLAVAALATALIIIASGSSEKKHTEEKEDELEKPIKSLVDIVTLCVYLGVSFLTGAWWITWLIFPIAGAVKGLIKACIDLKEVRNCEK